MSMRRAVLVLGLLEIFGPVSMDLYMPALPDLARDLGTSDSLAQATMSACMLGLALGQLVAGPLSDRLGRRRPLLVGVGLFAVFSLVCAGAPTIGVLLVARFLQGLAGSAGIVVALAAARDLAEGVELVRLLALLAAVGAIAPIVAPVVGGQLAAIMSWRGIFVVLAGIGAALFLMVATALHESLPPAARHAGNPGETRQNFAAVLHDRLFLGFLLVATCGGVAFFTYLASISFVLQDGYGLSPQLFSACFAANAVMSVVGAQLNRAVVRRVGPARMYVVGISALAVASSAVLGTVLLGLGLATLIAALALQMFFNGMTTSNGSALALADHGRRAGTAAALLGTSTFAVGPIAAPLVSLGGAGPLSMALTMALAYGCAAAFVWLAVRPGIRRRHVAAAVETRLAPLAGGSGNPV
jgi:DHA1 family bicyclomycin/chloramphenicol resistance-like MFS transporter